MELYSVDETIGSRIRRLRQERGLTQSELAKFCGVTKSGVSAWEIGASTNIRLEPLHKLTECLGVSVQYIILGHDLPPGYKPKKKRARQQGTP